MEDLFDTGWGQDSTQDGHIIRVAFESGVDREFDYLLADTLWPIEVGQRVEVPFGRANKKEIAFCVEAKVSYKASQRKFRLKKVIRVVDKQPLLNCHLMELARWISGYYVCPLGQVLAAMLPAAVKKGAGVKKQKYVYLDEDAGESIEQLRGKRQKEIVELLKKRKAFGSEMAVELRKLLDEVGCKDGAVKKLTEKQIIKTVQRTVFKSLPVIPKGLELKAEKIVLNEDQQKALVHIESAIKSQEFGVTLLHGVTDSGKTEVYIRAIESCLKKGKGAIILLPEIALTTQTVQRFSSRFERIALMHSALTAAQRNVQWQKIKNGQADVVIGARSAVFAPLTNLGLIVVDEEHEPSYKQDTAPRYSGRDVAIKRSQLAGAQCVLGSATPSLEMLLNCRNKKHFTKMNLPKRVMDLPIPAMRLVDMRMQQSTKGAVSLISEPLSRGLAEALGRGEQAILLLNRRGYSNLVLCPGCKDTLSCRNCDVTLTFHKSKGSVGKLKTIGGGHIDTGYAICHYCGAKTLVPQRCPLCDKKMIMIGTGSQRLEEQLKEKFPDACVARVDSDSMAGKDYYKVLDDFGKGRIDILAGTQMLAKGLHFPNVTVVGIISADTCLYVPDFRANERTFQLICQVAGRTGRSRKKGVVFVQTFLPDQPAIKLALDSDFEGFVKQELKHREKCNLPPYRRLTQIVLRGMNFDRLRTASEVMREKIDAIIAEDNLDVHVRGPMAAVISRIQRYHRMEIIVQAPSAEMMGKLLGRLRAARPVKSSVKVAIDVDPVNLL